jgi:hypothetical protein
MKMLKRVGVLALLLSGAGAAILPRAASAQDGYYYGPRQYYYQNDRDWNRHYAHEWREQMRRERRAEERREREWRRHAWRDHEWREHEHWHHRHHWGYDPNAYFYFGYRH